MDRWQRGIRWATRAGALCALIAMVAEFGFGLDADVRLLAHRVEYAVVILFAAQGAMLVAGAQHRVRALRDNWLDVLLVLGVAVSVGGALAGRGGDALERASVAGVQGLIVARMLLGIAHVQESLAGPRLRPALLLLSSFVALIVVGAAALSMPRCRAEGVAPLSLLDALFTSTSAVCVTGLSVRDVGTELSWRGQAVLLALIQLGGLGLVTIGTAITVIERSRPKLSLMAMAGDVLGQPSQERLRRFLRYTIAITLTVEFVGAAMLFAALPREGLEVGERAWWAVFHAVSAFCNAGFGLSAQSLVPWAGLPAIPIVIAALIVIGGLGFPVLIDLLRFEISTVRIAQLARTRFQALPFVRLAARKWEFLAFLRAPPSALGLPRASHLELNTKVVLVANAILIVVGALLFYLSEREGVLAGAPGGQRGTVASAVVDSFFQSVTARTAGFNSVDLGPLAVPTLLLLLFLMAIGASSASTGGGIKTGTAAVVVQTVRAMIRDKPEVEAFGRTIPVRVVNTAVAVVALYATAVAVCTTVLAVTQREIPFLDLLFESVSALSTVGLTHGVTTRLDEFGRVVIALAMLFGRLGPLVIVWTLLARRQRLRYRYPEEDVLIS